MLCGFHRKMGNAGLPGRAEGNSKVLETNESESRLSGWTRAKGGKDEREISLEMIRLRTGSEQKGGEKRKWLETFTQNK